MQKLFVESVLHVTPEVAWSVFESDDFRARLAEKTGLSSEVIEERTEGAVQVRVLAFTSGTKLPKIAAKALGTDRLTYHQTNRYDPTRSRLDWDVQVPSLGQRLRVEGETVIEPHPHGSRRTVNGEIEVKLRLVGGQIEKVVANEFRKSMEGAVDLARELMPPADT
jgi:hypothetical protein